MEKLDTWAKKSRKLGDDIEELFNNNNEFSQDIIKKRVAKFERTRN